MADVLSISAVKITSNLLSKRFGGRGWMGETVVRVGVASAVRIMECLVLAALYKAQWLPNNAGEKKTQCDAPAIHLRNQSSDCSDDYGLRKPCVASRNLLWRRP